MLIDYSISVPYNILLIGVKGLLQNLSEKQGKQMNSPESAKDIPKFIEFFKANYYVLSLS
jgi:phosphatidylserine decarboxylase